ncbi:peptidase S1, partial [Micromonospora sonneratiae]
MNEYETDPRRPSADADAEPPIPMDESTRGERGPADSEPASAPSPSPVTPLPSAQPVSPASPARPAQP